MNTLYILLYRGPRRAPRLGAGLLIIAAIPLAFGGYVLIHKLEMEILGYAVIGLALMLVVILPLWAPSSPNNRGYPREH
ncbi:MAG TPA: hypothetical protein VJC15_03195 [Candidatus Paceibacterota bacterium]